MSDLVGNPKHCFSHVAAHMFSSVSVPLEWFTLAFDMPWMLLVNDIRQGAFYAMLLSFWIVFTGEHIMVGLLREMSELHNQGPVVQNFVSLTSSFRQLVK